MWDFRNDDETLAKLNAKGMKPITYTEGHKEAMENGAVGYFECSVLSEKMLPSPHARLKEDYASGLASACLLAFLPASRRSSSRGFRIAALFGCKNHISKIQRN